MMYFSDSKSQKHFKIFDKNKNNQTIKYREKSRDGKTNWCNSCIIWNYEVSIW